MPSVNLLAYLTRPNPVLDRRNLSTGSNTVCITDIEPEGFVPWIDFTYETIRECYGDILNLNFSVEDLQEPPRILPYFSKLTDEACVTAILLKHNHIKVNCALEVAASKLANRGLQLPIYWSWGSLGRVRDDPRLRPDWAGTVGEDDPPHINRIPGDTKQSAKWSSELRNLENEGSQREFLQPLNQVLLYCTRARSRYGYIITDAEAYFFRRTKSEEPASNLSTDRPRRPLPEGFAGGHQRVTSVTSATSEIPSMGSSGSPYTDDGNPDINEGPLEYVSVPWEASGDRLTVNLGLWFIHLLAASDNAVSEWYPELGSWQTIATGNGGIEYRQVGSNKLGRTLPPKAAGSRYASNAIHCDELSS